MVTKEKKDLEEQVTPTKKSSGESTKSSKPRKPRKKKPSAEFILTGHGASQLIRARKQGVNMAMWRELHK